MREEFYFFYLERFLTVLDELPIGNTCSSNEWVQLIRFRSILKCTLYHEKYRDKFEFVKQATCAWRVYGCGDDRKNETSFCPRANFFPHHLFKLVHFQRVHYGVFFSICAKKKNWFVIDAAQPHQNKKGKLFLTWLITINIKMACKNIFYIYLIMIYLLW